MSDGKNLGLNDLGVPALAHWEMFNCPQNQPGDWAMDETGEVTCPWCLQQFEKMRKERKELIG